jgi:hypothetical protein
MTVIFPAYSFASSSTVGAIILQGPHQTAQKSTITRPESPSTSLSHAAEEASETYSDMSEPPWKFVDYIADIPFLSMKRGRRTPFMMGLTGMVIH